MPVKSNLPTMKDWKASLMRMALDAHKGNVVDAASAIGVSKSSLYNWIKEGACNPDNGSA